MTKKRSSTFHAQGNPEFSIRDLLMLADYPAFTLGCGAGHRFQATAENTQDGSDAYPGQCRGNLSGRLVFASPQQSPIVDGLPDGLWSKIAALHLVVGNAAKLLSHVLLRDPVSLLNVFAQHHFGSGRRTSNGHSASHALEFHIPDDIILNPQCD
jgi:hypothetical protein